MNREIKFRAWDKSLGKYKYPVLWDNTMPSNWPDWYELEQFTGIKDKHGNDIYEGDIVHDYDEVYKVSFGEYEVEEWSLTGWTLENLTTKFGVGSLDSPVLEILGNIHQTPDLLK